MLKKNWNNIQYNKRACLSAIGEIDKTARRLQLVGISDKASEDVIKLIEEAKCILREEFDVLNNISPYSIQGILEGGIKPAGINTKGQLTLDYDTKIAFHTDQADLVSVSFRELMETKFANETITSLDVKEANGGFTINGHFVKINVGDFVPINPTCHILLLDSENRVVDSLLEIDKNHIMNL